jgi:hypothetical protein
MLKTEAVVLRNQMTDKSFKKPDHILTALYGTFNLDMSPIYTIDVSKKIRSFIVDNKIVLPKSVSFYEVFGELFEEGRAFLQIKINDRIFNIRDDKYYSDVIINLDDLKKRIKIVYFLYVNRKSNWYSIVSGQLTELVSYGIIHEADIYIHIVDTENLLSEVLTVIQNIIPFAIITTSFKNQYEFPGIKLVYDLSQKYQDDIFIYFHSKGMSHNVHSRSATEMIIFKNTFESWRKHIQLFDEAQVNKVGLFPAIGYNKDQAKLGVPGGWIWYNFWYSKGSYLSKCESPIVTDDRFYYEDWLARSRGKLPEISNDCKSIYHLPLISKTYFTPDEAFNHLNILNNKFYKRAVINNPLILNCFLRLKQILRNVIGR